MGHEKTIFNIDEEVLRRDGEGSSLRNSERIMSASQKVRALRAGQEKAEIFEKKRLNIWMVSSESETRSLSGQYSSFVNKHNEEVRAQNKKDTAEYAVDYMDYRDLEYGIEYGFEELSSFDEIPELIVLKAEDKGRPASMTGIPNIIKKKIDKFVGDSLRLYNEDFISSHLGENICCPIASKFDFSKVELNEDEMVDYGLSKVDSFQASRQQELFEKYIQTGEKKHITEFFSDAVLLEIYKKMCAFDEDEAEVFAEEFWDTVDEDVSGQGDGDSFFKQFRVEINHRENEKEWQASQDELKKNGYEYGEEYDYNYEEVLAATDNYLDYRESIASYAKSLDFESIKEKMRKVYVATIKKELDAYADEYFQENDIFEAEKKLLKPILVCVSEDPVQRELMRDYGTDLVLDKLPAEDMQQLLELVGRMKASAASLMPDKLRRIKKEFYESVEDKLDARSEITADTEKEIALLEETFKRVSGVKKILDVGCGNGRIDLPLAEKGYEVLGIDANDEFLQSALKKSLQENVVGLEFKKGDVIDYREAVKPGTRDAVIYTWHTILEAFGPGNLLRSLGNARTALRPGGVVVFDQPTRENPHMEDGWYGDNPDNEHRYLSYIMTEEEIRFILKMAGFENIDIKEWKTKSSDEYPDGMRKMTVSARKPEMSAAETDEVAMYRDIDRQYKEKSGVVGEWMRDNERWVEDFEKRKSA